MIQLNIWRRNPTQSWIQLNWLQWRLNIKKQSFSWGALQENIILPSKTKKPVTLNYWHLETPRLLYYYVIVLIFLVNSHQSGATEYWPTTLIPIHTAHHIYLPAKVSFRNRQHLYLLILIWTFSTTWECQLYIINVVNMLWYIWYWAIAELKEKAFHEDSLQIEYLCTGLFVLIGPVTQSYSVCQRI